MNDKDLLKQQKTIANIIFHGDEAAIADYCQFASSYYSESYDPDEFDSYDLWSALKDIEDGGRSPCFSGAEFVDKYVYSGAGLVDPDATAGELVDWLQERNWFKSDRAMPWDSVKGILDAFKGSAIHDFDQFSGEWLFLYWAQLSTIVAQEVLYPAGWCVLFCEWDDGTNQEDLPGWIAVVRRGEGDAVTRLLNLFAPSMCAEEFDGHAWALWKTGSARQLVARLNRYVEPHEQTVDQGVWRKLRRELRALMADAIYA